MRDDIAEVSNLTLDQYEDAYLAFLAAFNRQDLATAFAALTPDCEFSTVQELLGERWLIGREQVTRFFEEVFEVLPDWHVEPLRFLQAADDVFVTLERGRGTGRSSGAPTVIDFATIAELRDSLVARVRQYSTWEEGLRAAGFDPSIAADVRRSARSTTS